MRCLPMSRKRCRHRRMMCFPLSGEKPTGNLQTYTSKCSYWFYFDVVGWDGGVKLSLDLRFVIYDVNVSPWCFQFIVYSFILCINNRMKTEGEKAFCVWMIKFVRVFVCKCVCLFVCVCVCVCVWDVHSTQCTCTRERVSMCLSSIVTEDCDLGALMRKLIDMSQYPL